MPRKASPEQKLKKDISKRQLTKEHVLATVLQVMERTYIRVGNYEYEKLNGSYGLTTLKQRHIKVRGATMRFAFPGKKGIFHTITLKNKRLARIVKSCSDIPGKMLFQYIDDSGERHAIDSGMVNDYIKEATNSIFTTKDLRTWSGSLLFLVSLKALHDSENDKKSNILLALDEVSAKLGNTRTVCRNYYVHPGIVTCYEKGKLDMLLQKMSPTFTSNGSLSPAEKSLMQALKKCNAQ